MSYAEYGLDETKKEKDDDVVAKYFWCMWCDDHHVTDGFSMCFSTIVICHNCVNSSGDKENAERWEETDYCFKCKKNPGTGYRSSDGIASKMHLCKACMEWAKEVLNNKEKYFNTMVQDILKSCVVEGNVVKLPEGKLDRKAYLDVKNKLELIGGKWKGNKIQGFVFEQDPTELLEDIQNGDDRNLKKEFQFFPTPKDIAIDIVQLLKDIYEPEMRVLEPSAGDGALIKALRSAYPKIQVECFELMELNRKKLQSVEGAILRGDDFLKCDYKEIYDIIIANPPFTKNQDIDHIRKMFEVLKPGGTIVTLASPSWYNSTQKKQVEFQEWLESMDVFPVTLPTKSFQESGTNIAPLRLIIQKPVIEMEEQVPIHDREGNLKGSLNRSIVEALQNQPQQKVSMKKSNAAKGISMLLEKKEEPMVTPEKVRAPEFKNVPAGDITADKNQPRKFFLEESLNELTESIRAKGIIQPILLRYSDGPGYLLVCGERRLRAAKAAGLTEVPAVIKQMGDDEALELQIVENLQRKDVSPMEEATAFKSLSERFSVEEIGLKVGKHPSFVAQRIKLTDLIPDFQEMLFLDKMTITQAVKLSRLLAEDQKNILKESIGWQKGWKTDKDYKLGSIDRFVTKSQQDLDKAAFKTNDPDLYPEMGSCNKCRFNTANNQLLFPELNKKRFCTNGVCFEIKCQKSYQQTIKAAMEDPEVFFITNTYYLDDEAKVKVKSAKEAGAWVLESDHFKVVDAPEHPGTWEDYLKENDGWTGNDAYSPEEIKEELDECREEYDSALEKYNTDLKKYEEAKSTANIKKAFVVAGNHEGKMIDIILKPDMKKMGETLSEAPQNMQTQLEVSKIKEREQRNKELDAEKVHTAVQEVLQKSTKYLDPQRDFRLTQNEIIASALALFEAGSYSFKDWMIKQYGLKNIHTLGPKDIKKFERSTEFAINEMLRHFIIDKLPSTLGNRFKSANAAIIHELALENEEMSVNKIVIEQDEKAAARIERVDKRIAALEKSTEQVTA